MLFVTATLGLVGFIFSIIGGDYIYNSLPWLFNPIASFLPLPTNYRQGPFIAQWLVYALWFIFGGLVLTVLVKRRGTITGSSKSGPPRRKSR